MFISPSLFQVPAGLSSTLGPCEKQGQNPSFQSHDNFPWMVATHSSILAWEIPLAEESGGLPSKGPKELGTTEHRCRKADALHREGRALFLAFPCVSFPKNQISIISDKRGPFLNKPHFWVLF